MSFARKIDGKYDKKLMDTAAKTGINAANLIGNKIAGKITSVGKSEEKEKTNKAEEIYI